MESTSLLSRTEGAVQASVDGEVVLLSPLDFSYHALDPVGACIWEILEQPRTIDQLIASLVELYAVDESTCRTDVVPFVKRMVEIGALTWAE